MNKSELIAQVVLKTGLTKRQAEQAVNAALDTVAQSLQQGEKVQLSGFGTFEVRARQPRVGRNPYTGEAVHIPAALQPVFTPSKLLKDQVKECDLTSI